MTDSFRSLIKRSSLSGVDPDNISSPGGGSDPGENGGGGEGGGSLTLDEGQASDFNVPRIAYINKYDRVGTDFFRAIGTMHDRLGANAKIGRAHV